MNEHSRNNHKKAKKQKSKPHESTLKQEIESLREYIKQCPTVSSESNAIRIALNALSEELRKIDRDGILVKKFTSFATNEEEEEEDTLCVDRGIAMTDEKSGRCNGNDDGELVNEEELMEWQDIGEEDDGDLASANNNIKSNNLHGNFSCDSNTGGKFTATNDVFDKSSLLCRTLSQIAISDPSHAAVFVSTPVAALALAIHSALRSRVLGFKCTGIPPDESSGGSSGKKGFAAPVRELPKSKFLPDGWDLRATSILSKGSKNYHDDLMEKDQTVSLRYRKDRIGVVVLRVGILPPCTEEEAEATMMGTSTSMKDDEHEEDRVSTSSYARKAKRTVRVRFGPIHCEPSIICFPLDRYVNLDAFYAALSSSSSSVGRGGSGGVRPALYYKSLAKLMLEFCKVMDLGSIDESSFIDDDDCDAIKDSSVGCGADGEGKGGKTKTVGIKAMGEKGKKIEGAKLSSSITGDLDPHPDHAKPLSLSSPMDTYYEPPQFVGSEDNKIKFRHGISEKKTAPPSASPSLSSPTKINENTTDSNLLCLEDNSGYGNEKQPGTTTDNDGVGDCSSGLINFHSQKGEQKTGDFSNDLLPPIDLDFRNHRASLNRLLHPSPSPSNNTGNLMGPNHPTFWASDNVDEEDGGLFPALGGGLGMHPRFDPYYPPGVYDGGRGGRFGGRGGRFGGRGGRFGGRGGRFGSGGNPNPDHQRPPSDFGSGGGGTFL